MILQNIYVSKIWRQNFLTKQMERKRETGYELIPSNPKSKKLHDGRRVSRKDTLFIFKAISKQFETIDVEIKRRNCTGSSADKRRGRSKKGNGTKERF